MPSDPKKESLLYSLFNRSKQSKETEEEQFTADTKEIERQIEELESLPPERVTIGGEWLALTPDMKDDVRAPYIRLWISSDKMQAKALRVEYVPEKPKALSEEINEEAQAALAQKEEKARELEEKMIDESISMFERVGFQQELSELRAELEVDSAIDELDYEWDEIFVNLALTGVGIKYGIIDEAIQRLLAPEYNKEIIIAQGLPPVDGVDGYIEEFFPRDHAPSFEMRPDGSIDFKNMHLVTNVKIGTVIARLFPPKQGEPGVNIMGTQLNPRTGQSKILSRGENTDLVKDEENPDISNLVSKIDGNLVFKNDKFSVENVYNVAGNVDNSTGNINFLGNVVVTGDVYEGYEIRTPGDIKVHGMVEGASLFAGGNINLEKGINGMTKGILEAGGDITAKFIENCNVKAKGNINSESIINCKVECDQNIKVSGKGIISGGKLTAFGSVEAKVLGSRSSTLSIIVLGITPRIIRERNELEENYKKVCREFDEIRKNIEYLEQAAASGKKIENCEKKLAKFNGARSITTLKKQRLEMRREAIIEEMRNVATCTFSCTTAYPPARITIGNSVYVLKETMTNCRFYRNSDGEISVGMK